MNKTESLNLDGSTNPRTAKSKEEKKIDTRKVEEESTETKKQTKRKKIQLWCVKIFRGKKKKKKKPEEKEKQNQEIEIKGKTTKEKSKIPTNSKNKRAKKLWKKTKTNSKEEDADSILKESRSGTSTREEKGLQMGNYLESKVSAEERKQLKAQKKAEKLRKSKDSSRLEKSVSYATDNRDIRESNISNDREILTRDITKSCCFLCTENSLAIAAAIGPKPICSDKSIEAYETETIEKSCSPIKFPVHVRTIKSSIRIKVKDTCTSYAKVDTAKPPKPPKPSKPKKQKKRKKFRLFPKVKHTICPVKRTVGCVTEDSLKSCKPNEEKKHEPCCKDKAV
ncbi:hypothetical protein M0804_007478 [Polistes exclamans]|nr:hypothetical protein M0804_007478 [Polistes exclamans]